MSQIDSINPIQNWALQNTTPPPPPPPEPEPQPVVATDTLATSPKNDQFVMPVQGEITSEFGNRIHPISGEQSFHDGIDIGASMGDPVQASKGGTVISAGEDGGYGNCVVIDHGNGELTRYAHLSEINVQVGDSLQTGQQLGKVGSTGNSTGPHLHFEIIKDGTPVDPLAVLNGKAPLSAPPNPGYAAGGGAGSGGGYSSASSGSAGGSASSIDADNATSNLSVSPPANRAELLKQLSRYGITEDWLKKILEALGISPDKMDEMINLVLSMIQQESGGDANARSGVGAIGLMQLMPGTAAELGVNPNDPQDNVRGGVKYIMQMLDRFNGDAAKAVAAYNAGPGAVEKYGGVPPYAETQNYVQKVLGGAG